MEHENDKAEKEESCAVSFDIGVADLGVCPEPTSQFQQWKEARAQTEGNTMLEKEMELAMHLWNEAYDLSEGRHDTHIALQPQEIVESLQTVPIGSADGLVSWRGLQVGWFLNVFCKTRFMKKLLDFGCELWFIRKVCMIEIIRQVHCSQHNSTTCHGAFVTFIDTIVSWLGLEADTDKLVKPPTMFISYTGGYTLQQTLDVLHLLDSSEIIWMDIFCVNQFAWTGHSRSFEMQEFKHSFMEDLKMQIKAINNTTLILKNWKNVMETIGQIWVLWEIFNTAEAGAKLNVLLPPQQLNDFIENCLESQKNFGDIMSSLASIDAQRAKAEDDSDRQGIFSKMQHSGLSNINNLTAEAVRSWLLETGMSYLARMQESGEGATVVLLNNLALLLHEQGKLDDSEPLFRQALEKKQNMLGHDHPDTLSALHNLAGLLKARGKLEEAELLFEKALTKKQKILGVNHPSTLDSLNNLASLLQELGKQEEAKLLFLQAVEKKRDVLGGDHPSTIDSINNLALLLHDQGKWDEAESLFQEALGKFKKILGPDHPSTLTTLNNLAALLQDQGKWKEAEVFYREALEKKQKVLGLDHPDTLTLLNNFAGFLRDQGHLKEAELLYLTASEKRQNVLGPNHPDTLSSLNDLALVLRDQGKLGEAEPLFQQALETFQNVLGPNHPNTLTCQSNLASLLQNLGRRTEAASLYEEALQKKQIVLGLDHPSTLATLNNLALLLQGQGKLEEAESMLREALNRRTKVHGTDHSDTILSMWSLATLLYQSGQLEESFQLLQECKNKCTANLHKDHPYAIGIQRDWEETFESG